MKYLSEEWLAATKAQAEGQAERPGVSVRMAYVVTGAPDGDVKWYTIIENGILTEAEFGELEGAEVILSRSYDDAKKIDKGDLDANAAFMQGRIKVSGTQGIAKLMQLMPLTNDPTYKQMQADLAAQVDWD